MQQFADRCFRTVVGWDEGDWRDRFKEGAIAESRNICRNVHRETHDLCARQGSRALRYAHGPRDRSRLRSKQLQVFIDCFRNRPEHAVPDESQGVRQQQLRRETMFITKMHLSRRAVLRGMGATLHDATRLRLPSGYRWAPGGGGSLRYPVPFTVGASRGIRRC